MTPDLESSDLGSSPSRDTRLEVFIYRSLSPSTHCNPLTLIKLADCLSWSEFSMIDRKCHIVWFGQSVAQLLWIRKFSRDFYFAIFLFSNYWQVLKFASKHSCIRPFPWVEDRRSLYFIREIN